jgi:YVTN family beta-propeller protein
LAFSPREQALLDDGRTLVVADAFGGNLAAVDVDAGKVISTREMDGHNIRGMAISQNGERLLLAHQNLNPNVATSGFNVHWGGVMKNMISEVLIADVLRDGGEPLPIADVEHLGFRDEAAGDPGALLLGPGGERIVAFAGVSEIAISPNATSIFARTAVGRRPAALALSADGASAYVANMFGDSVSVVSVKDVKVVKEISLGPQPELGLSERGEMLFYDARLSSDGWYSCNSCHIDGHSNGLLNDNFGDGSFDAVQSEQYDSPLRVSRSGPRRVLSLLGTAYTRPWAWDGKQLSLWGQIRKSIEITMQGPSPPENDVTAIENFLYTLQPPPSVSVARGTVDQAAVARGKKLFERLNCADCHQSSYYTSPAAYDVGLEDKSGNRQFNPPQLLGASQRSTFFHDSRARSLREVFEKYQHNLDEPLPADELDDLIEFIESL